MFTFITWYWESDPVLKTWTRGWALFYGLIEVICEIGFVVLAVAIWGDW